MQVNINGLPVNIEFNFAASSCNKLAVVTECCNKNNPFILFANDKDFEVFIPGLLVSFDHCKQVVKYNSIIEFQVALGFCVMAYDYASPIQHSITNATTRKLLPQ